MTKKTSLNERLESRGYKRGTPLLMEMGRRIKPRQQDSIQLAIAKSARHGKSCQISYTKLNEQFGVYDVQRYSFRQYKGIRYFYGYDIHQGHIKSFISMRISNVSQLDTPHKRLWIVQMGNDPQVIKYWKAQRKKTPQQKRAQQAGKTAQQTGQQVAQQAQQNRQPTRQDIVNDVSWTTRYIPPQGRQRGVQPGLQPPQTSFTPQTMATNEPALQLGRKAVRQAEPVIKTIMRGRTKIAGQPQQTPGSLMKTPVRPRNPTGTIGPRSF